MSDVSFFTDEAAITGRALEVPDADFTDGMNNAASNAPGVGVNALGGAVAGTPEQFTLLDQDGDARVPQVSQVLGGAGFIDVAGYPSSGGVEGKSVLPLHIGSPSGEGDGKAEDVKKAELHTLVAGWVKAP